jgi:hypothetical protein
VHGHQLHRPHVHLKCVPPSLPPAGAGDQPARIFATPIPHRAAHAAASSWDVSATSNACSNLVVERGGMHPRAGAGARQTTVLPEDDVGGGGGGGGGGGDGGHDAHLRGGAGLCTSQLHSALCAQPLLLG